MEQSHVQFEIIEHTADVRLRIRGRELEELFRGGLEGLMHLLAPEGEEDAEVRQTIRIEAPDTTYLLVDFLNEVLWLAHTHAERYTRVDFQSISPTRVEAELAGRRVDGFGEDIKAVTYHEADVQRTADGYWETMLVFDI